MKKNTIINGDCRKIMEDLYEEVRKNDLPNEGKIVVVSDPPYNQGYHYDEYEDDLDLDEYLNLLEVFRLFPSVVIHYPEQTIDLLPRAIGRRVDEVVSWVYPSNTAKQHRLISWWGCEPDFRKIPRPYKNPNDKRIKKRIEEGKKARGYDWWEINQVKNVSKKFKGINHSCPIPEEVASKIIKSTTEKGDIVIDPFAGSGTVLKVARELGRDFIGIELSENYCEIAEERLKQENLL